MNGLNYKNVSHAFVSEAKDLRDYASEVAPRGQKTLEFINRSFTIVNPLERHLLVMNRWANPFAQIAETLWTLSGRNDLDWLERYIPQCKKWSDDGKTWRAAYGPRLRNWYGINISYKRSPNTPDFVEVAGWTDQISYVISKLNEDPYSRQAVITLWDPIEDTISGSKDYPCNDMLQFLIRDGKLHLSVHLRSNDIVYGFSHNDFYLWSVLQELVANCVGVKVGTMTWFAGSFHVYEKHFPMLDRYELANIPSVTHSIPMDVYSLQQFDEYNEIFFRLEDDLRIFDYSIVHSRYVSLKETSKWFAAMYIMMVGYDMKMRGQSNEEVADFLRHYLWNTDLYYSVLLYFFKDKH